MHCLIFDKFGSSRWEPEREHVVLLFREVSLGNLCLRDGMGAAE